MSLIAVMGTASAFSPDSLLDIERGMQMRAPGAKRLSVRLAVLHLCGVATLMAFGVQMVDAEEPVRHLAVNPSSSAHCSVSASKMLFADHLGSFAMETSSAIKVGCSSRAPYAVGLDRGTGSDATVATRKMTLNGRTIGYSLYQDAGHTKTWGNATGVDTVGGTGSADTLMVYGKTREPAGSKSDPYSDTVIVTVTY